MPPVFPLPVDPPHAISSVCFLSCTSVLINLVLKTLVSALLYTPHHLGAPGGPSSGTSPLCPYRPTLGHCAAESLYPEHTYSTKTPCCLECSPPLPLTNSCPPSNHNFSIPCTAPHPSIRHSSLPVLGALCTFLRTSLHWALTSQCSNCSPRVNGPLRGTEFLAGKECVFLISGTQVPRTR